MYLYLPVGGVVVSSRHGGSVETVRRSRYSLGRTYKIEPPRGSTNVGVGGRLTSTYSPGVTLVVLTVRLGTGGCLDTLYFFTNKGIR